MPNRPTDEEIRAFLRILNLQSDPGQYWRSVAPEQLQIVARPGDIKTTFAFGRDVASGPSVTSALTQTFGPTVGNRMLLIRGLRVDDIGANPPEDIILSHQIPGNIPFYRDSAPSFPDPIGGNNAGSRAVAAQLPFIVYPGDTFTVQFSHVVPVSMEMRVVVTGEEFEVPLRNMAT